MILFLYGLDSWRKEQKIKQLTERFIKEVDPSRMNLATMSPEGIDEEQLTGTLRATPFLARKRMIVLKNFITQKRRKALYGVLLAALPSLGEDRIVVVSEDGEKPKAWATPEQKQLWEYLEKEAKTEAFLPIMGAKLEAAIVGYAKECGLALEKPALERLAILSGGDLGQIEREIEKLSSYCSGRSAKEEDVALLCTIEGEENVFAILDALNSKDKKALLKTAEVQLEETDALHLVSRVIGQLRAIRVLMVAGEDGARASALHPFQVKKISAHLRRWNVSELKTLLATLMRFEYAAKRGFAPDLSAQITTLLASLSS